MSHRIPAIAFAGIVVAVLLSPDLGASTPASGRLLGIVRDAAGVAIADASVLAVGQTIVSSRSDVRGRFQMAIPPGDYVLKATRTGYVSTYREPVRVDSTTRLERTITLTRQGESPVAIVADDHAHTDLAWRLRHLPRSVLRDENESAIGVTRTASSDGRSSRLAFFDQDFTGQVNLLTTASTNLLSVPHASAVPRGVAFIVVGAPVGISGDWRVRGAIGSGDASSWNLLGEYASRDFAGHEATFGVSYSAQNYELSSAAGPAAVMAATRRVAGVSGRDVWRVNSDLLVSYAMRADRYDYLKVPNLYSGTASVRARLLPRTYVEGSAARNMVAPGAEEFLPPAADGPWLPAERTFSSLFSTRDLLHAEDVRHLEIGFARDFGRDAFSRTIRVRAFRQQTADQMVTLFGSRDSSDLGHYRVAQAGEVQVDGWTAGIDGVILGRLSGSVEYSQLFADWGTAGRTRGLRLVAPSVLRHDVERVHDVLASLDAAFNNSETRMQLVYRYSSAFGSNEGRVPVPGSRFDLQVHQALPYHPSGDGSVELIFAVRTLFRDIHTGASFYDELLTVRPPTRFMGGIQVRF